MDSKLIRHENVIVTPHLGASTMEAQPMAPEYVFGEEDSEDEVDDDVADLEDRRVCWQMHIFLGLARHFHPSMEKTLFRPQNYSADNNGQEDSVIQALNFSTIAATSGFGNSANNVIINNSRFSMTTILPFKVQAEKEKEKTEKEKEKAKIEREKAVKEKIDKENILERMMKMKAMLKSLTKQLP
ncbi:hypothetical protein QVD17_19696 [Tagetes erecta]|uniref:Polycomb protein VEFS-Box domain-containing protein n=1 Tax=Tagetes erecta TaxID=13708 RepID=A0AAD8NX78_TARER|nr:hypothetical protein QVD17_19696 [Tagetes erecta]